MVLRITIKGFFHTLPIVIPWPLISSLLVFGVLNVAYEKQGGLWRYEIMEMVNDLASLQNFDQAHLEQGLLERQLSK